MGLTDEHEPLVPKSNGTKKSKVTYDAVPLVSNHFHPKLPNQIPFGKLSDLTIYVNNSPPEFGQTWICLTTFLPTFAEIMFIVQWEMVDLW